jgi:hypothetical protein
MTINPKPLARRRTDAYGVRTETKNAPATDATVA